MESGADADADTVEVGGFSGLVVGLSLCPHVAYALFCAYNVAVKGEAFALGPYGLELIACSVSVGLTLWSLGSFVQRGRGLPAGPLGILGLAEGLSYLAALALLAAGVTSYARDPNASKFSFSVPSVPSMSLPAVKVPDFKVPEVSAPSFKAPDIKVPEVKIPQVKVPEVKIPEVKVPEVKIPEVKKPEVKIPDVPKPAPAPAEKPKAAVPEAKPPAAKPAPEPEKPKAAAPEAKTSAPKKDATPDFDSLFD